MWQPYIETQRVIDVLTTIRREWQEASNGEPLEAVYGSVGMLLDDVAQGLDINLREEQPVDIKKNHR